MAPPELAPVRPRLDVAATLKDRRILFVGATGFVGKVALSMLLRNYPGIGKVYVLVRPGAGSSAEDRFFRKVAGSPAFDPIREVWGEGFEAFLREKVVPLPGDAARPLLNFTEADLEAMRPLDAIINCAGLVSFNPTLEAALRINVYGVQHVLDVARRTGARVVHVSTCFVAGHRDGEIWEDEPVLGYYPRREALEADGIGADFTVSGEVADCERAIEHMRARADDRAHVSLFRERGAARLVEEGRDPSDEKNLKIAIQRERKMWMAEKLTAVGMERAQHWGWPNTYTYTKSLGEQVCAEASAATGADHVRCTVVRPAIVESAVRYPMTGWNEGFTTTAPLTLLTLLGHRSYPIADKLILDVIPVDHVAAGLISTTAATIAGQSELVYQLCSGDVNPFFIKRTLGLLGLYKRRYYQKEKKTGPRWLNHIISRLEPVQVNQRQWRSRSAPRFRSAAQALVKLIDEHAPTWGAPRVAAAAEHARQRLSDIADMSGKTADAFELFMPFINDRKYVFRADHTRALHARLSDVDQALLRWDPEAIDWRYYWLEIHTKGLEKWVFPSLEEEFRAKPRSVYTYKDLLELFDATTRHHRQRTAMRQLPPVDKDGHLQGEPRRWTYGDLQDLAQRGAAILRERGVQPGDRVMLLSENRPEWGMAYFAILKAGASVVPVDANASGDEVQNLLGSSEARAAIISDRCLERLAREHDLPASQLVAPRLSFDELLSARPRGAVGALVVRPRADDLASLIFTSGTTGRPKGVMLSHRNFSSLLSKLGAVFDIDKHDGLLSVLPLHHTLEFTAGLLMPLMRGAQISYMDEVNAEGLSAAFDEGHVTGMVGVPALWQLLHRRITRPFAERGRIVERLFEVVAEANRALRDGLPPSLGWLNLGRLLFYPVHRKLGGRLRLMISGGSALPVDTMKLFRGLGFGLYEGYGLTEASPVLTVTRPGQKLIPGSVGEALPGIEVKIDDPDARGVGEVIATGPNIMVGYYQDAEATSQTVRAGWLHTGDLGRIEDGKLFIVGRKKEMILGASGENVYPDELEDVYREPSVLKELSIVGLPSDGSGEIVACLAVPEYGDGEGSREEARERAREHFRAVSGKLPLPKRVKVLHLVDYELPKTATRKVKRKLVVEELQKLEKLRQRGEGLRKAAPAGVGHAPGAGGEQAWLREILAEVTGQPAAKVIAEAQLADLGFDSLTYTELAVALEAAGLHVPEQVDLTGITTVGELEKVVAGWGAPRRRGAVARAAEPRPERKKAPPPSSAEAEELPIPELVARWGSSALDVGQRLLYERYLDMRITGKAHLRGSSHFLVAANHTSHLDMGLVKMALGDWGPRLVALAAKDYFFEDPLRRAYFENFTNLVPMERHGSLRESLRLASEVIKQGYVLLIFPEGTRSADGVMGDFKPSIGYLALANKIDVLPMYLEGTHDAMPRGSALPRRGHRIAAHIGPVIGWRDLQAATAPMPRNSHYREAARIVEEAVRRLAPRGNPDHRGGGAPRLLGPDGRPLLDQAHPGGDDGDEASDAGDHGGGGSNGGSHGGRGPGDGNGHGPRHRHGHDHPAGAGPRGHRGPA